MRFDDLDKEMRVYETTHDLCILPNMYIVARLDGRSFTKLTKEKMNFKAPFDIKFRDLMIDTAKYLMDCGFKIIYGYTESDEISLLFHLSDDTFSRKMRKLNSTLAGIASAKFTSLIGHIASFDCRISQLPNEKLVVDYFRWRGEDAHRNALGSHCYWNLRNLGHSARKATSVIKGLSHSEKNELLFKNGVNFNDIPNWQKRGVGLYWDHYLKSGINKNTGLPTESLRKKIKIDLDLPMKQDYSAYLLRLI